MRRRLVLFLISVLAWAAIPAAPATASPSGCSESHHCYSILDAYGTRYYGMYGTWNRAWLAAGSPTTTNHRFVNSEMWLSSAHDNSAPFVEVGMKAGYFAYDQSVGYLVFGEWQNGNTTRFHKYANITGNDTQTDEFQISRAATSNAWRVYWNGNLWTTTSGPGFWSSTDQTMGGEVASPVAKAHLFTMYGKGLTSSGARVNFGTDVAWPGNDTPAGNGAMDLYGSRPADSTWKWRIPE